jgi:5'-nucleotidase
MQQPYTIVRKNGMSRPLARILLVALLVLPAARAVAQQPDSTSRLRILVVNDDGYQAPGLVALIDSMLPLGDVFVAAPLEQQSGTGHGITYRDPIKVYEFGNAHDVPWYAVGARPATVTRVALTALMDSLPDLVVSGINAGDNVGTNAWVSGTVAAAREAALHGVPALAFSTNAGSDVEYYRVAAGWARRVVETLVRSGQVRAPLLLNVNIPAAGPAGVKVAPMSLTLGEQDYDRRTSPRGLVYLWDDWSPPEKDAVEGTDLFWFSRGFVTVTPLRVDQTDPAALRVLEGTFGEP